MAKMPLERQVAFELLRNYHCAHRLLRQVPRRAHVVALNATFKGDNLNARSARLVAEEAEWLLRQVDEVVGEGFGFLTTATAYDVSENLTKQDRLSLEWGLSTLREGLRHVDAALCDIEGRGQAILAAENTRSCHVEHLREARRQRGPLSSQAA